jgi:hypothetical protein
VNEKHLARHRQNKTINQTNPALTACVVNPKKSLSQKLGNFTEQLEFADDGNYFVKITATDNAGYFQISGLSLVFLY